MPATILIVEDDPAYRTRLNALLSGHGYTVLTAEDGEEAGRVFDRTRREIDLAIVDLVLPNLSGPELIGHIARRAPAPRVIAMSGLLRETHMQSALLIGADTALEKSVTDEVWIETIRGLLDRRG